MASIFEFDHCQDFLSQLLKEAQERNFSFSLRAFARTLGVSPSHMSRLLHGRKKLSLILAHQMSLRLRLSQNESEYFIHLVRYDIASDDKQRAEIAQTLRRQKQLGKERPLDAKLAEVCNWECCAILALTNIHEFVSDAKWIAHRLGLSENTVLKSIEKLSQNGFLQRQPDGKILPSKTEWFTNSELPSSETVVSSCRQYIERARHTYEKGVGPEDEYGNLVLAVNAKNRTLAKQLIRSFLEKFNQEVSGEGSEVFQLSIQFFQNRHHN